MSLTFDAETHTYRWNGELVPGVTSILRPLCSFDFVKPDVLAAASAFGTAVHKTCELADLGTLDEEALDPELAPYLAQWRKFCADFGCEWEWIEAPFYHQAMRYAGTVDRIGTVKGQAAVLDIKTSASLYPSVGPQLAAYARAYAPDTGQYLKRFGLRLHADGYELKPYTSPADWSVFCSLITLRGWCAQHNVTPSYKEIEHV
jgi:hypothetical protein